MFIWGCIFSFSLALFRCALFHDVQLLQMKLVANSLILKLYKLFRQTSCALWFFQLHSYQVLSRLAKIWQSYVQNKKVRDLLDHGIQTHHPCCVLTRRSLPCCCQWTANERVLFCPNPSRGLTNKHLTILIQQNQNSFQKSYVLKLSTRQSVLFFCNPAHSGRKKHRKRLQKWYSKTFSSIFYNFLNSNWFLKFYRFSSFDRLYIGVQYIIYIYFKPQWAII